MNSSASPTTRSVSSKTSALLLLDLQKDFLYADGRLPIPTAKADKLILVANHLIRHFQQRSNPVVLIGNEFSKTDWIGNWFRNKATVKSSDGTQLDPRLERESCPYFPKSKGDAFSNPDLDAYLRQQQTGSLCIGGVYTEGCIRATAVGAIARGYRVYLVTNAVASNSEWKHTDEH